MATKSALLVLLALVSLSFAAPSQQDEEILYFPNPADDGETLIPGRLTPNTDNQERDPSQVHFLLYTKDNRDNPDELFAGDSEALERSHFKRNAEVKFMSHGFGGNYTHGFPWNLKNAYLDLPNEVNIILIDWSHLADNSNYFAAVQNTKLVGPMSAELLEFLISQGAVAREQVYLIGFSLGCHVVGIAGGNMNPRVPRLTGLDPARPLLDVAPDSDRLDPTDAEFVDVIHTAGATLAFLNPVGDVDFYPNGGAGPMPGCGVDLVGSCSHQRSPAYWLESVATNPFGFRGTMCDTWQNYQNGACVGNQRATFGQYTPTNTPHGKYYLETAAESPYAQG